MGTFSNLTMSMNDAGRYVVQTTLQGSNVVTGNTGPAGPTGPKGPTGQVGFSGVERISGTIVKNAESKTATVDCTGGNVVINGGYIEGAQREVQIVRNQASDADTWTVRAVEDTDIVSEWELQAFAICGTVSP